MHARCTFGLAALAPLALALVVAHVAGAQEQPTSGALTLTTERVIVFKDGYALFHKRAMGTAGADGRVWTAEVPDAAILGSFWAQSPDGEILGMTAGWHTARSTRTRETACVTMVELLRANLGREVTLTLAREDAALVSGRVAEVLELAADQPPAEAAPHAAPPTAGESVRELTPVGARFCVIERTEGGRLVLPIAEVRNISGPDLVTTMAREEEVTRTEKRLTFDLGEPAAGVGVELSLLYFSPDVRWIPTYRIEEVAGQDGARALVRLQGEVLNEAEDWTDAALDLVVGVPNFRFKDTVSPLVLERALRSALRAAAPQLMGQQSQMSNAVFTQRAGEWRAHQGSRAAGDGAELELAPELGAGGQQDLFVYAVGKTSLARGARRAVPLWQAQVPLAHLYTMDLEITRQAGSGGMLRGSRAPNPGAGRSPLRLVDNHVWHQLELTNSSEVPWTTGAALLLEAGLPLGQDLLTYTPPGGATLLPVTVAIDVRGTFEETELERQTGALRWDGHSYARIRKRGTVRITNYRSQPAKVRIRLETGGRVTSAEAGGRITLDDSRAGDWDNHYPARVNNHSRVVWELELEPGQTAERTCELELFVR